MSRVIRRSEIRRRRARKAKIKRLKAKIKKAGPEQIQLIVEKLRRVSPFYPVQGEKP